MEDSGLALVKEIGNRLRNPCLVKKIVFQPHNLKMPHLYNAPTGYLWEDLSLANGYPGILLLLAELDRAFPNEKWDFAVHEYVLKIKEGVELRSNRSLSLFEGLPGICFAFMQASRQGTRYQKLIDTLNKVIIAQFEEMRLFLKEAEKKAVDERPPFMFYELIYGIIGVGVYALKNKTQEIFFKIAKDILSLLITRVKLIEAGGRQVPGWFSPASQLLGKEKNEFPNGNFNLGQAHGVSGILAFLSIAALNGVVVPEQMESIKAIIEWLKFHQRKTHNSFFWPSSIPFEEEGIQLKESSFSGRDAWCYGTPSTATSLYLGGKAINNATIQHEAVMTFKTIFNRPDDWNIPGLSLCHGRSGLLMMTHSMALETQDSILKQYADLLKQDLLNEYQIHASFGFKEKYIKENITLKIDQPGLLEGASGILLALHSTNHPCSAWHTPFLITDNII